MEKLKAIVTGVKNTLLKNEEVEELAQKRLAICKTCEFYNGVICKWCGCYTEFKIRQNIEKCPKGKW
ncbi:MAG: hypothetical protein Fur0027_07130 [Raineya sp.]